MRTMPMIWASPSGIGRHPCAACGRELRGKEYGIHIINGGGEVLHPDDEAEYWPDGGDMGVHYVGPECRKKFGEFIQPRPHKE